MPLYLLDFTSNLDSEALMIALRRGWIQQEISYGVLHTETTKRFVEKCIESESFGELATFLRRRVKAMKWYLSLMDSTNKNMTNAQTQVRAILEE